MRDLLRWAVRIALARARLRHLDEDALVSDATMAVHHALRKHPEGKPISEELDTEVRRRVWSALDTAGKRERRRHRREVHLDDVHDDEALAEAGGVEALVLASPERSVLTREQQARLDQEVDRLPPRDRRLYVLRHREERGWDEIEDMLGIPDRTLRSHDLRIRRHLTRALRAWAGEED